MDLFRAVYTSRPFGYDAGMLNGILTDARRCNLRDEITGALICRADIYLQWLEGPEDKVRAAIARIQRDDRHVEVKVHIEAPATARLFGDWDMLHDPAASWIWSQAEVTGGAVERATPDELVGFFQTLKDANTAPKGQ